MPSTGSSRGRVIRALAATLATGLLTYAFLIVAARVLDRSAFDEFSVFWSGALVLAFGLFLPVEQEMARLGASLDRGAVRAAGIRVATEIGVVLALALLVAAPLLAPTLKVSVGIVIAFVLVALVSIPQYFARGVMHVNGAVNRFSDVLVVDAGLRVVFACAVSAVAFLFLHDSPGAAAYAITLPAAIFVAHVWIAAPALRGLAPDRALTARFRTAAIGLMGAGIFSQVLVNAGPIVIHALQSTAGEAGAFQATFNVTRIPLLIVTPLQAIFIAPMARMTAEGAGKSLAATLTKLCLLLGGTGIIGAIVGFYLGPWVIELAFGEGKALGGLDTAVLILGVFVHVALIFVTQAVVALGHHLTATWVWFAAAASAAVALILFVITNSPLTTSVAIAFGGGSAVGLIAAMVVLLRESRRSQHAPASPSIPKGEA